MGLGCIHGITREQHLGGDGFGDEPGETLRASRARDDAELDLGHAKARTRVGDSKVARHRELQPTSERDAIDRSHTRLWQELESAERALEIVEECTELVGRLELHELFDVGARRERLPLAGDHDGADGAVIGDARERRIEIDHRLRVDGIELFRAAERDERDGPAHFVFDGHGRSTYRHWRCCAAATRSAALGPRESVLRGVLRKRHEVLADARGE